MLPLVPCSLACSVHPQTHVERTTCTLHYGIYRPCPSMEPRSLTVNFNDMNDNSVSKFVQNENELLCSASAW